jgi:hypothetical protein
MLKEAVKLEKFGRVPEGNYVITLDDILLEENVVSIYSESIPKDFMKSIRNKEKANLTDEQVRQIEAYDLGSKGNFDDGQPKPRFQNRINFIYHDEQGNKHSNQIWGGPKLNKALTKFIEQAVGIDMNEHYNQNWNDLIKIGDKFNVHIKLEGDFNNLDVTTIRKVGLPALPEKEGNSATGPKTANGFSQVAAALLVYLQGEGAGMPTSEIASLHTKGLTINGIALNDFGPIALAWGEIKTKAKQSVVDGKVNIILE